MVVRAQRGGLQTQFSSPPVSPLGVEPNLVAGFHADPLCKWSVLLLRFRKDSQVSWDDISNQQPYHHH